MSRLLGIINPNADPNDYFARWIWRSDVPWDAEMLNIEQMEVEAGNIQFRILGPHTPKVPDGVFLKLQVNKDLNPQIAVSGPGKVEVTEGAWRTSVLIADPPPPMADPNPGGTVIIQDPNAPVVPQSDQPAQSAPAHNITVATTEQLPGETKTQQMRRKAIALRWQAAQLEKLADDMQALEAQGLI